MPKARILALTNDGRITYCTCSPDQRGKGRCNHVMHQNINETSSEFTERVENLSFAVFTPEQKVNASDEATFLPGLQEKYWDKDRRYLYKIDIDDQEDGMVQYNGLAEDFVSNALGKFSNIEIAEYESCFINGKNGVKTKNFLLNEHEEVVPFDSILNNDIMNKLSDINDEDFDKKFNLLISTLKEKTGKDFSNDIIKLIKVDIFLMSADRHFGNISLVFDKETGEYRFSPIYDNGSCLLAEQIYQDTDAYGELKLDLPFGPQIFGILPVKHYIEFVRKHSNELNRVSVNPDELEEFIEEYGNEYYSEDKVEKIKWLFLDNVDFYNELEVVEYEY